MGMGGQRHALAVLPPRKRPVSLLQEPEWASGPICLGAENLAPTGIRSPDLPVSSESLYRLRYSGPQYSCQDSCVVFIRCWVRTFVMNTVYTSTLPKYYGPKIILNKKTNTTL